MNLNYRGIWCPLGKITSLFPGAHNRAVFQWTVKLLGMLMAHVLAFLCSVKATSCREEDLKEMVAPLPLCPAFSHIE